jgi:hypothetical protein
MRRAALARQLEYSICVTISRQTLYRRASLVNAEWGVRGADHGFTGFQDWDWACLGGWN